MRWGDGETGEWVETLTGLSWRFSGCVRGRSHAEIMRWGGDDEETGEGEN